jgi:hypothetical protein
VRAVPHEGERPAAGGGARQLVVGVVDRGEPAALPRPTIRNFMYRLSTSSYPLNLRSTATTIWDCR